MNEFKWTSNGRYIIGGPTRAHPIALTMSRLCGILTLPLEECVNSKVIVGFEHVSRFSSCRKKMVKLVLPFLNGYECDEYNFELERFPHIGEVKNGNNVEVTSNCPISRGALSDTPNWRWYKIGYARESVGNLNLGFEK